MTDQTEELRPALQAAHLVREGHVTLSCSYEQAYAVVERAMLESEVTVKERSPQEGALVGTYGFSRFFWSVVATFYSDGGPIHVEFTVPDRDIYGQSKRKVRQITDRVLFLLNEGHLKDTRRDGQFGVLLPDHQERGAEGSLSAPPTYAKRASPSFKNKAVSRLVVVSLASPNMLLNLALWELLPTILGLVLCVLALRDISTSRNKAGQGLAITGVVIGLLTLLVWMNILFTGGMRSAGG
jgi:hypothetical protein